MSRQTIIGEASALAMALVLFTALAGAAAGQNANAPESELPVSATPTVKFDRTAGLTRRTAQPLSCSPTGVGKWLICGSPTSAPPRSPDCVPGELYNTAPPVVSGSTVVGSTLSSSNGSWYSCLESIQVSWGWFGNSQPPRGNTYDVVIPDIGAHLWTQTTACNTDGDCDTSPDSNMVGPVTDVVPPPPSAQCSDGRDNDGDGYIDAEDRHGPCYSQFEYRPGVDAEGPDWSIDADGVDQLDVQVVDSDNGAENTGRCRTLTAKRSKRVSTAIPFVRTEGWHVQLKLKWCHDNRVITSVPTSDPEVGWVDDLLIFPERLRVTSDCGTPGNCEGPPVANNQWSATWKAHWQVEDCFPPYKALPTICNYRFPWIKFAIYGDGNYGCTTDTGAEPCKAAPPTAVTVQGLRAQRDRGRAVLSWRTASEINLLGFNVYRKIGTRLVRLNPSLISSVFGGSVAWQDYSWIDRRRPTALRYRLQIVTVDGSRHWVGSAREAS